uniref:Ig-like domain-containing protein n=2 Tax=Iconisemion striatum TaxID=60296 RepID=A0A1A7YC98_9TELE
MHMQARVYIIPSVSQKPSFTEGTKMKWTSVLKVFGCLCLLFANGFPVSEVDSPKIIGPPRCRIRARPAEQLVLHCDALAHTDADETLIYWLVDGSFPEEKSSHDRIVESNESNLLEGSILHKSLVFKNVTREDFKSTFSCVVTNAAGKAQKHIKLTETTRGRGSN